MKNTISNFGLILLYDFIIIKSPPVDESIKSQRTLYKLLKTKGLTQKQNQTPWTWSGSGSVTNNGVLRSASAFSFLASCLEPFARAAKKSCRCPGLNPRAVGQTCQLPGQTCQLPISISHLHQQQQDMTTMMISSRQQDAAGG